MSKPFSVSSSRILPATLVTMAILLAGFTLVGQTRDAAAGARDEAEQNAFWSVSGPPCPETSRDAFAAGLQPRYEFDFNEVSFARAYGEADCRAYGDTISSYRKCMFSSPGVVRVTAGAREAFYTPGIGKPATVTVEKDHISCVIASRVLGPAGGGSEVGPTLKGWLPKYTVP
jgi:hypothetical protein